MIASMSTDEPMSSVLSLHLGFAVTSMGQCDIVGAVSRVTGWIKGWVDELRERENDYSNDTRPINQPLR